MSTIKRTEDEGRSSFPGMSFEEGVTAMYNWLTGISDDAPDKS